MNKFLIITIYLPIVLFLSVGNSYSQKSWKKVSNKLAKNSHYSEKISYEFRLSEFNTCTMRVKTEKNGKKYKNKIEPNKLGQIYIKKEGGNYYVHIDPLSAEAKEILKNEERINARYDVGGYEGYKNGVMKIKARKGRKESASKIKEAIRTLKEKPEACSGGRFVKDVEILTREVIRSRTNSSTKYSRQPKVSHCSISIVKGNHSQNEYYYSIKFSKVSKLNKKREGVIRVSMEEEVKVVHEKYSDGILYDRKKYGKSKLDFTVKSEYNKNKEVEEVLRLMREMKSKCKHN